MYITHTHTHTHTIIIIYVLYGIHIYVYYVYYTHKHTQHTRTHTCIKSYCIIQATCHNICEWCRGRKKQKRCGYVCIIILTPWPSLVCNLSDREREERERR